ncbi:MAG TPA: LuxR C-terminal-related transcriptional regulator [Solirubrobacteraceae bacterium]|nr:LuxR C-terminal-related transcriptional regulator [Solirubrobacteraceae bacterium]
MSVAALPPRAFPDPVRGARWRRREGELVVRVAQAVERSRSLLGADVDIASEENLHPPGAIELVSTLTWAAVERLQERNGAGPRGVAELCALVADLQALVDDLYSHELTRQGQRLAGCEAGLARLRAIDNTADLVDRVCPELIRSCGFERATLARIEDGRCKFWKVHFTHPNGWEDWMEEWFDNPESEIPLAQMGIEAHALAEGRPELVSDPASNPLAHRIVVDGASPGYVIAPIIPAGGKVVGIFHADHYPLPRRVDTTDRDMLWIFAEGFAQIYERTLLLERLRSQRGEVRRAMGQAADIMDDFCNAEVELSRHPDTQSVVAHTIGSALAPLDGRLDELTAREREVLSLIASGATNGAIAEQLVITEGTVKSHVKHILRKLGAANRSQAIASYLGGSTLR